MEMTPADKIRAYLERVDERAVLALLAIQPEPFWMDFRRPIPKTTTSYPMSLTKSLMEICGGKPDYPYF